MIWRRITLPSPRKRRHSRSRRLADTTRRPRIVLTQAEQRRLLRRLLHSKCRTSGLSGQPLRPRPLVPPEPARLYHSNLARAPFEILRKHSAFLGLINPTELALRDTPTTAHLHRGRMASLRASLPHGYQHLSSLSMSAPRQRHNSKIPLRLRRRHSQRSLLRSASRMFACRP